MNHKYFFLIISFLCLENSGMQPKRGCVPSFIAAPMTIDRLIELYVNICPLLPSAWPRDPAARFQLIRLVRPIVEGRSRIAPAAARFLDERITFFLSSLNSHEREIMLRKLIVLDQAIFEAQMGSYNYRSNAKL